MKTFRVVVTVSGEIDLTFEAPSKKTVEKELEKIRDKLQIDPEVWKVEHLVEVGESAIDYDFGDIEQDEV